ncbi:hypothetical protein Tco_0984598, partial [Tanacetum coccineum]
FSPRNYALPDVLRLESWQPAWSASVKAVRLNSVSFGYHRPILMVPFRATGYEVEILKDQLDKQGNAAQERERVAKELQQAVEEREMAAEQQVKKQVKDIVNMLKTLKLPSSPPPI